MLLRYIIRSMWTLAGIDQDLLRLARRGCGREWHGGQAVRLRGSATGFSVVRQTPVHERKEREGGSKGPSWAGARRQNRLNRFITDRTGAGNSLPFLFYHAAFREIGQNAPATSSSLRPALSSPAGSLSADASFGLERPA